MCTCIFVSGESLSQEKKEKKEKLFTYLPKGQCLLKTLFKEEDLRRKFEVFLKLGKPKKNIESVAGLTIRNRMEICF